MADETISLKDKLVEKAVDHGFDYLNIIHTEAGVAALILALFCLYLMWSLWRERKANKDATSKLFELGVASAQATTQAGSTLEKIYQLLAFRNKEQA